MQYIIFRPHSFSLPIFTLFSLTKMKVSLNLYLMISPRIQRDKSNNSQLRYRTNIFSALLSPVNKNTVMKQISWKIAICIINIFISWFISQLCKNFFQEWPYFIVQRNYSSARASVSRNFYNILLLQYSYHKLLLQN